MNTPPAAQLPFPKLTRIVSAQPRLFACALLGLLVILALSHWLVQHAITRIIIGWNVGACAYLGLAARMMFRSSHERMRSRALSQDEGRLLILALVVMAALSSLAAIIWQLSAAKDLHGSLRYLHIGLSVTTLLSSWAFTQLMFALHYAHDYYAAVERACPPGLEFPGGHAPDYWDFLYFACVIGTSGQTADISFSNRTMRRTGLVHCVLAFFFNATLLSLMINIGSGLI